MMTVIEIAARFDLKRAGRSWRGTCPACGYCDTFVLSSGTGGVPLGWCASCQDRHAIARAIRGGETFAPTERDVAADASKKANAQERALSLWRGSEPTAGTAAEIYLSHRGLARLASSPTLRFRGDTPHPEGGRYRALIALVSTAHSAPLAVHRTYLSRDGRKANVTPVKASLGPVWGGAIRLHDLDPDRPLVIGEGIETAASAGMLTGLPAWAAISAGNLAKGLVLPPEAKRIVIATDPDDAGRAAAGQAWKRWTDEGREVRFATPDRGGDFNDLLMAMGQANG